MQASSVISLLWMSLIISYSGALYADDVSMEKAKQRLTKENGISLDAYAKEKPTSLKEAIDASREQNTIKKREININLKEALKPFDHPEYAGIVPSLSTEEGRHLSVMDVRALALKNNLSIQVARAEPGIAGQVLREEAAKFDQIIYAYAKYADKQTPPISGDNVGFKSNDPLLDGQTLKITTLEQEKSILDLEAGIKIPLRTGGYVTLSTPLSNVDSRGLYDSDEYRSALKFSFSQPLLRNAGTRVNEASIRIAEVGQESARLNTRLQTIRVVALIDKAYWALYEAWGELDVRRSQYEYASQNLEMVKRRVQEGLTAAIEINRAEIGVAERMDALVVADTNLKLAQRQLKFLLNDLVEQNGQTLPIIPETAPNLTKFEFDRERLLQDAMGQRIELLDQELKLSADLIKIDYLENQTLPLFTLDYQYGGLSSTEDRFSQSYSNVLDGRYHDWSIGLKLEIPVSNEARKARLDQAVEQRMQRLTTKRLQELSVKREIYDALDKVDQDWQRILIARQRVLIAGMNYEAELKQFNEGLRTMTEVLETLTRLGEAQIQEIRAIHDYQISLVDTAYATGTILGYGNLEFQ